MEDNAIPMKFPDDMIELAVLLFSGGKKSDIKEKAKGLTAELIIP
jgi:hypothetical protein